MGFVQANDDIFETGRQPRQVDLVGFHAPPTPASRQAVAKAGGHAIVHEAANMGGQRGLPRITSALVIVEAQQADIALQLLLADIRDNSAANIILVLADLSPDARLAARLHGADHVVGADCDARELAAIVRNELRTSTRFLAQPRAGEEPHHWRLDEESWSLIAPNDRVVRLTRSEFDLMRILIGHAGLVQPRHVLRAAIEGDPSRTRVLDAVLSRLRRKVWDCARMELPLRSARGEGYVFAGHCPLA
jgi:DNA-binding response OmpR family regulator